MRHSIVRPILAALSLTAAASAAPATDKPALLRLCHEQEESFPWILNDRPGLNIVHLKAVSQRVGVPFEFVPAPWKRCLEDMKSGVVDGAFKATFKADRLEMGAYPMAGTKPDDSKALMTESYSLYRLKGSTTSWDGSKLVVGGPVAAQPGYSIGDVVRGLGAKVDDGSKSPDANLKKLMAGRVDAVALQTAEADNSLRAVPEFSARIEKVGPPLSEKPYFLMLSRQLVARNAEFAASVWKAVAEVRESADYKAKIDSFK